MARTSQRNGYNADPEFLKQITQMGILGYDARKIINVMDITDPERFTKDFQTEGTQIWNAYQQGKDKADWIIDMKLFNLAKEGNIKALEKLEDRRKTPTRPMISDRQKRFIENTLSDTVQETKNITIPTKAKPRRKIGFTTPKPATNKK